VPTDILIVSIVTSTVLTLLKVVGGLLTGSYGVLADGFHSLCDVIAMTANHFGMKASLRPANGLEAYENYKNEVLGTFVVSFVLFVVGMFILVRSYMGLIRGVVHAPGLGAAVIIIVAFIITYWLYLYSKKASEKSDSPGLAINTKQILLNVLSTVAVLIGLLGSCFTMNYLDPVAAIVVALIILYTSLDIIHAALKQNEMARLTKEQVDEILALVTEAAPKAQVTRIKTLAVRKKIWLLLELAGTPRKPLAAELLDRLDSDLRAQLPYLDNVIVRPVPPRKAPLLKVETDNFARELRTARNYLSLALGIALVVVFSAAAFGVGMFAHERNVLIPADINDVRAGVSAQLGRAPYFYLYRMDKKKGQFITNRLAFSPFEVDLRAARFFKDYHINAIITQNIGPIFFDRMTKFGIGVYQGDPYQTIQQQIELFRQGRLKKMTRPNVNVRFGLDNMRLLRPWSSWQPN